MAHGAACPLRSKDPVLVDRLATNYRLAELDPAERAMLDIAVKVTEASARIGETISTRSALRAGPTRPSST